MEQTARIISTYSADVMGVSSALFELGGMTVMHDASGCNSTYTTHDEPRWYDMDSMVYISGLSEMEAIMGDDDKLIDDICEAAEEMQPKFIAIAGSPISAMTGFDYEAVAEVIEKKTGIPSFGFPTTGMNTYIHGASMAFEALVKKLIDDPSDEWIENRLHEVETSEEEVPFKVNILGLTPLDFSVNGEVDSLAKWLEDRGFEVGARLGMGSSLEEIGRASEAEVNLVVSGTGLGAAKAMYRKFAIPSVIGLPIGLKQSDLLEDALLQTAREYRRFRTSGTASERAGLTRLKIHPNDLDPVVKDNIVVLIGEGVMNFSLANSIRFETGHKTKVLCATECPEGILREWDKMTPDEDDIIPELAEASYIIADPLYRPICPDSAKFIPLPSEAFSGRMYRDDIPDLVKDPGLILNQF
jgi:nitrogenase molybdenum-iron protein alpha/beta subunit